MQVGTVQKLISIFSHAFQKLEVDVELGKLEALAVTVHRAMTVQARHFHTLEHVFSFVDPDDPVRTLAALYHDVVYYQVDMGFSPQILEIVSPYLVQDGGEFLLSEQIFADDSIAMMTLDVFDLLPGQRLVSLSMLNEFLSALVMNKQLESIVALRDLLRMTLCIEATIPFRPTAANGRTHFDELEDRMKMLIQKYGLNLVEEDVIESIQMAVTFANKDIENFAEYDAGHFLDNTWKLLPETNAALRLPDVYSIGTYRQSLQRMQTFFNELNPASVFSQYRGVPTDEQYHAMIARTRNNVEIASEYLRIKIVAVAILEALAIMTGGDAPLSLFLGDLPREGVSIKRLEYFLPEQEDAPWVNQRSEIYQLLETGRASDTSFDLKNAPLSLFVYKSMSPEKISEAIDLTHKMQTGQITAEEFLQRVEPAAVRPIAQACAVMVFTRRQALLKYAGSA